MCGVLRLGRDMSIVVRARYVNGVLKPLERLDLEEGEEVVIEIKRVRKSIVDIVRRYRDEYGVELPREAIEAFLNERR